MSRHYTVAFLAGHGIGPEVTAEASRVVGEASRLHGFVVDDRHVPFGADAFMRFGHPYPSSSRRAVLAADAVLVGPGGEALDALEAELDVRASLTRLCFDDRCELSLLAPADHDAWEWTLRRAVRIACGSRARLAVVGPAPELHAGRDGLELDRLTAREAMRALVVEPQRFDVLVCPPELGAAAAEVAACATQRRTAAWGRLADSGPSVFGAGLDPEHEVAGQGVADPRPMLLAAALMLGEGLGERSAARTLERAVLEMLETGVRTPDMLSSGEGATTREFMDTLLASLPAARRDTEFAGAAA
jgi:isocitrate/isopropylmalate dehydrogenase